MWSLTMAAAPEPTVNPKFSLDLARERDPRVRVALEFLVGSASPRSLAEAARIVNLSGSRLRHLIREEIGIPLHIYVKGVRLCRARELVQGTFLSVKEITSVAGFNDISHFLRDYKAAFGETPSQARRRASRLGQ